MGLPETPRTSTSIDQNLVAGFITGDLSVTYLPAPLAELSLSYPPSRQADFPEIERCAKPLERAPALTSAPGTLPSGGKTLGALFSDPFPLAKIRLHLTNERNNLFPKVFEFPVVVKESAKDDTHTELL